MPGTLATFDAAPSLTRGNNYDDAGQLTSRLNTFATFELPAFMPSDRREPLASLLDILDTNRNKFMWSSSCDYRALSIAAKMSVRFRLSSNGARNTMPAPM